MPKVNTVCDEYVCPGCRIVDGNARMIRRVREVLRLEAEARALPVDAPALALERAVEEVARCRTARRARWSRRRACGRSSARRTRAAGCSPRAGPVQHPVVIVAVAVLQLRDSSASMRAPIAVGLRKSNGVPVHRCELAGRNQRGVDRRVAVGVRASTRARECRPYPGEIEVAVLRQVDGVALSVVASYLTTSSFLSVSV